MSAGNALGKIRGYLENNPGIDVDGINEGYVAWGRYDSDAGIERIELGTGQEHGYRPALHIISDAHGERFESIGGGISHMDVDGFSGCAFGITPEEYTGILKAA